MSVHQAHAQLGVAGAPDFLAQVLGQSWGAAAGGTAERNAASHGLAAVGVRRMCAKPYAMLFFTATPGGHIWITREAYGQKPDSKTYNVGTHESAPSVAKREWLNTRGTGCNSCIFDQSMKAEHGHGFSLASAFENEGWEMIPSIRNRLNGKASVHSLLQTRCADGYPVLQVFGENCPHFLRTFPALPYATTGKNANEDVDTDAEDHLYDALQYVASSGITTDMMMHIDADRDGLAAIDEQENAKIWSPGWQHRLN